MGTENIYTTLAKYTDLFYNDSKDYDKEVNFVVDLARRHNLRDKTMLDVCCGAAPHARRFAARGWKVIGVDLNDSMLKLAKRNFPKMRVIKGDLKNFSVPTQVSLIIVMFNSINYAMSYDGLDAALKNFHKHLKPGGIIVFDSFFVKEQYRPGHFSVNKASNGKVDVARVTKSFQEGELGVMQITHIIHDGKKKTIIEGENRVLILDPKRVLERMEKTGFRTELYKNFDFDKNSEGTLVFVGQKSSDNNKKI